MMLEMRTTLTLDDDVAGLLKRRALELGIPFKEALNRTIRAGLGEASTTRHHPAPKYSQQRDNRLPRAVSARQ